MPVPVSGGSAGMPRGGQSSDRRAIEREVVARRQEPACPAQ
jgi:hypothetical protein